MYWFTTIPADGTIPASCTVGDSQGARGIEAKETTDLIADVAICGVRDFPKKKKKPKKNRGIQLREK